MTENAAVLPGAVGALEDNAAAVGACLQSVRRRREDVAGVVGRSDLRPQWSYLGAS